MDRERVDQFLEDLTDRFYGYEIVEILEDAGILDIHQLLALIEDYVIEGKDKFRR